MTGEQPSAHYEILVEGVLGSHWSHWFDGLRITSAAGGRTSISGPIADQAALHGLIAKVRDLGLALVEIRQVDRNASGRYPSLPEKR